MYDELVKRLRYCGNAISCIKCPYQYDCGGSKELLINAADAIEELGVVVRTQKAVLDKFPRWIPVTERLPEKHEWVLVRSKLVKMKTDFISNDGNWYTTPGVTHWMPLPEPPKESES